MDENDEKLKLCGGKGCQQWKPQSDFGKNKRRADGLDIYCKECTRKRAKKFIMSIDPSKFPKLDTPKKCANCNKTKQVKDFNKNKYATDGRKAWCKVCLAEGRRRDRLSAFEKLSRETIRCEICGETHWEFLDIDHINNDGEEHRKVIHGGHPIVKSILQGTCSRKVRLLCSNCNWAKRVGNRKTKNPTKSRKNQLVKLEVMTKYSGGQPKCSCCPVDSLNLLNLTFVGDNKEKKIDIRSDSKFLYRTILKLPILDDYKIYCCNCLRSISSYRYCPHQNEIGLEAQS